MSAYIPEKLAGRRLEPVGVLFHGELVAVAVGAQLELDCAEGGPGPPDRLDPQALDVPEVHFSVSFVRPKTLL